MILNKENDMVDLDENGEEIVGEDDPDATVFEHDGLGDEAGRKFLKENAAREGVIIHESGLQYRVNKTGYGTHHPASDAKCLCWFKGMFVDGLLFDSSDTSGGPVE